MTLGDLLNSAVLRAGAKRGDFVGKNRAQTGLPAQTNGEPSSAHLGPLLVRSHHCRKTSRSGRLGSTLLGPHKWFDGWENHTSSSSMTISLGHRHLTYKSWVLLERANGMAQQE